MSYTSSAERAPRGALRQRAERVHRESRERESEHHALRERAETVYRKITLRQHAPIALREHAHREYQAAHRDSTEGIHIERADRVY